ncbi:SoxR reducing system RseC family protein [Vogesella sp. LYT5W]|uniref:SoxR reducing system RseC family protein n=1 Tax=Vogesella margarita TaxID=2984199 RepID=A0ABT5IS88_9NEIS|nr:SoxR reducing system RseC family protein [Vogesella margarita]MDC7715441.1 SoxR reducing system RseC family protein [Vogesella margarita]
MLETEAQVVSCQGGEAMVRPTPHSPCGQCDPQHGCRSLSLARMFVLREPLFRVRNPAAAGIGDKVIVAVHERALLVSTGLLYCLPLLALLVGAVLGRTLGELPSVLLAFSLFALTLWWVKRYASVVTSRHFFMPTIVRRVDPSLIIQEKRETCRSRN